MNAATAPLTRTMHSCENWNIVLEAAAREVFELMLGCKLTTPATPPAESHDITSMVGLAGQLCGVLILGCSVESSTLIASRMLGVQPAEIGSEGCDAFGEICNMIAGNFKNKISGLGNGCMLSVQPSSRAVITTSTRSAAPKPSKSRCCSKVRRSAFHFGFTISAARIRYSISRRHSFASRA